MMRAVAVPVGRTAILLTPPLECPSRAVPSLQVQVALRAVRRQHLRVSLPSSGLVLLEVGGCPLLELTRRHAEELVA